MASSLRSQIGAVVAELDGMHGHRTLWLDGDGRLWHFEPEDELESRGYVYVATLMRPSEDDLMLALARFMRPNSAVASTRVSSGFTGRMLPAGA